MNPHLALDLLVCGYASKVRSRKLLAMVEVSKPATHVAFIDESNGSASRKILLLAACIQEYDAWAEFSENWHRVLHEGPSIDAFHMRDARGKKGNFKGWKRVDIDLKIIALVEVIVKSNIRVAVCWVDETIYKETIAASGPIDFRSPYYICFHTMVTMLARAQSAFGIETPIDYVFDEKGDTGQEALMWYAAMKDMAPDQTKKMMGSSPVFRNDEDVLPLQAADLIAWRERRKLESPKNDPELASSMRLDELTRAQIHINRRYLERMALELSQVPHIAELKACGSSLYQEFKSLHRKENRRKLAKEDKRKP